MELETTQKIQLTDTQKAKLDAGGVVVIRASWDEFMELLPEINYRPFRKVRQYIS